MPALIRSAFARLAIIVGITGYLTSISSLASATDETDIFDIYPGVLNTIVALKACSHGVYAKCDNPIGCRAINGVFKDGQCQAKPLGRSLSEKFTGTWVGTTSLPNTTFFNYLSFDEQLLAKVGATDDYLLWGGSHASSDFASTPPNPVLVSHDSTNNDWFLLDFWGTDIRKISAIEITQTSENQFDGCEFVLNYPALTYLDGVCHPVRLRRYGSQPQFTRILGNLMHDIAAYASKLFDTTQASSETQYIADKRPSINQIWNLLSHKTADRNPVSITAPQNLSTTNAAIVSVQGTVEETANLVDVTLNGSTILPKAGTFSRDLPTHEGANRITVVADYGRRSYSAEVVFESDSDQPTVVSAASANSSSVMLQFSETMGDATISDTNNFNIVRNDNHGRLPVTSAAFTDATKSTVLLQTGVQSDTLYTITAVNVKDAAGNPISEPIPEVIVNLASATFAGTPPTGNEVVDTDGDGLLDHVEMAGWPVKVTRTDGSVEIIMVTSDPFNPDTDGDGIPDGEERHGGMDPRNGDTDGDTLTDDDEWNRIYSDPVNQDTDGDGIQDGFEYLFFKTSPILADTDGDQIDDPTELTAGNRNPLIADLPSPDISIGNVNLQLDTRFVFTNEEGVVDTQSKTVEATLTQSEDDTFSTSNEASTTNTLNFSQELSTTVSKEVEAGAPPKGTVSASITATVGSEQGSEQGSTNTFGEESSRGSEEAYHDSLTLDVARDTRESITREVVGASMKVDLRVANSGDIPFTVSNLELTAQAQDPRNRRRLIPIASLTPENVALGSVNIGVLGDTARGPFVFKSESIFPQEIQDLMKNPRGLVVQLANFDIVDEQGNNFAFASQQVLDRTVGITFDLGDGRVESYRVATASEHDANTGQPIGISMARALEIIGLSRYATVRDGGNGISESTAGGDDVQVVLPSQTVPGSSVEPKTIVVSAGPDGVIDAATIITGDDILVPADYATEPFKSSESIIDGGNGLVETLAAAGSDDFNVSALNSPVKPGQVIIRAGSDGLISTVPAGDDIKLPGGVESETLVRFRDVSASDEEFKFWVLYSPSDVSGIDLNAFQLRSGQQYDFAFVKDQDLDGVWAREEYLHGTSDLAANTDGCDLASPPTPCDTISDFDEIRTGWRVQLKSSPQSYLVYPNPNQGDSDRDGLTDDQELACGTDPRQRDTDLDGLSDRQELFGLRILDGVEAPMQSLDPDNIDPPIDITVYTGMEPVPLPLSATGASIWANHPVDDDCDAALARLDTSLALIQGYATDPLDADTDGDFVNDLDELTLGLHPNDASDGASFLDDDGDGIPNAIERAGRNVWVDGRKITVMVNGVATELVPSDPNKPDTDQDGLPDLLEQFLGSNPDSIDTDGDGITDSNEYKNGGAVCVGDAIFPCVTFDSLGVNGYRRFELECEAADICDVATIEGTSPAGVGNSQQLGTNLNLSDTDRDGHIDGDELVAGQRHQNRLNPASPTLTTPYSDITHPLDQDSDDDGISDGSETYWFGSNPGSAKTDSDDGLNDGQEVAVGRNPAVNDRRIAVGLALGDYNVRGLVGNTLVTRNRVLSNGTWETRCEKTSGIAGTGVSTGFNYGYANISECDPIPSLVLAEGGSSLDLEFSGGAMYGLFTPCTTSGWVNDLTLSYSNTEVDGEEKTQPTMHVCAAGFVNFRRDYVIRHHDDSSVATPPLINTLP